MEETEKAKLIIGLAGMGCVTFLQVMAWYMGHNGTVFALTSTVIGGVTGYFIGWSKKTSNSIKEYVKEKSQ